MSRRSLNDITMQQPIFANRFIWVIKDFSEYHANAKLTSPEFIVNTVNGVQVKCIFEINESSNENDNDDSDSDDEYKLVFCFNNKFNTGRKLVVIYSIVDRNGIIIHDEQTRTVTIAPNNKVQKILPLIDGFDIKHLIFKSGVIVMHICITDVTLDKSIITNLVKDDSSKTDMQPNIFKQFINFYETKDLCDFVIIVEDKEYHVHKFALAASSPVFASLFIHEAKTSHGEHIIITHATAQVVQEMLHYIYTGYVHNMKELANDLLKIAHKYSLDGLVKLCEDHLKRNISANNVLHTLACATKYNLKNLKFAAHMFFILNIRKILDSEEFNELINSYAFSFNSSI